MPGHRAPKRVSPSTIARYYFQECERFLRYVATPVRDRPTEGIPAIPHETSPVTKAILEGGYVWEEAVVGRHIARRVEVAPAMDRRPVRERVHSAESSRYLIPSLRPGHFVYQPTLQTPPSFYARYGIDPEVVVVTDCRPDLVECFEDKSGRPHLRVIDVKASPGLKLSHRVQATLYTLILEHALSRWGVIDREVAYEPGVWLANTDRPETFDVRAMRPPLEDFLERELQALMERPAGTARWHVYFRCEWCEWFQSCQEEMRAQNNVSRLPYLSSHAKRFLGELEPSVTTLGDLETMLRTERAAALDDCASLRGTQTRIAAQARALLQDAIYQYGASSLAMPRGENVRIILTLQTEPVSGQVYAYGIYVQGVADVLREKIEPMVEVAASDDAHSIQDLERRLVGDLHRLMRAVHDYNTQNEGNWSQQKTLQVYVFDTYESELLIGLLVRRVLDAVVADRALDLFFHFQEPELVEAEDHPANEVFFPAVVLVQVLRSLLALPIEVAYRFADAVRLVAPTQHAFQYRENRLFSFQLSNQMRSDAIFQVWRRDRQDLVEAIKREVRARLWATNTLINGIREAVADTGALFAWPPKFQFPDRLGFRNTVLSRLAFIARYESALQYLSVREARMLPIEERLRSGDALRLTFTGGLRFEVDPMHRDLDIGASGYLSWLLTEDVAAGQQAALSYHDYANRERVWVPKNAPLAVAAITHIDSTDDNPNRAVLLDVRPSPRMPPLRAGQRYLLHPRFTDFNTSRCQEELRILDQETDPAFARLLSDPGSALPAPDLEPSVRTRTLKLAGLLGMTPSQRDAMDQLIRRSPLLVWGPPGTGKTHFIGLAILCLAAAHHEAGRPFRVLVSAFTHAAIDNCLRKLAELNRNSRLFSGGLPIAKLGHLQLQDMQGVAVVHEGNAGTWLRDRAVAVVGGTAWAVRKKLDAGTIDAVVLDEGSQLKVPESAIAIRRLRPGGVLVVAGDDRQLPPIVQGAYPDPQEGEPLLHRSIFECLRTPDRLDQWTAMLLENFRMNRTLCRYPAEQVYLPEYVSASDQIAQRRLALTPAAGAAEIADLLIDPGHPLVIGVLEGVRAAAENRIEADLVAAAACRLRRRLVGVADDADYWRRCLFVVSPHHAQIHAIRRALRRCRDWQAPPFVDTVDRMQGQECDAVIASYGVSDVEYAMQEAAFIYSLNRLNVSITRARAKTIVFLPRPLIEPPIQAYEDETLAEGVAFMQGLVQFAQRNGEVTTHDLPDRDGQLLLLRVPELQG